MIPPIPPQSGNAVGFDFVGKFSNEWKSIGVGICFCRKVYLSMEHSVGKFTDEWKTIGVGVVLSRD
jgi:hypothetical protein